ncbi:NAD(P)/FAD-dependent oxidoreductase [Deinococcus sonorensis]|uniref:FAD-dependent oxidoreductase n=1 Tax=Deinococcus sonorensis KR-87 TaxID=694439 RepID=A0AAU7U7R2_9DEIO
MKLLVIGGGIAGASVAYFAAQAGLQVTVIDAAEGQASRVPAALLNPVRGQSGRVDPRALEGLQLTWQLIETLSRQGHAIPHARSGLLRPLPDDRTRQKFESGLPTDLPHHWLTPDTSPVPLAGGWAHVLHLPDAGWLDGGALTDALIKASGAVRRPGRARHWDAQTVTLEHGERLQADAVVWCGGSRGADWAGLEAVHRAGSVLTLDRPASALPLSYGAYLIPAARGGVLGATFEAPSARHHAGGPPLRSLQWLLQKGAALTADFSPTVTGLWTGVRLSGERSGRQPGGWFALSGLSSKGFLLGPLLARRVVASLAAERP